MYSVGVDFSDVPIGMNVCMLVFVVCVSVQFESHTITWIKRMFRVKAFQCYSVIIHACVFVHFSFLFILLLEFQYSLRKNSRDIPNHSK